MPVAPEPVLLLLQELVPSLLVVPYRKSEIEIIFAKILFFDDDRPCSEFVACVTFFTFCN